MIENAPSLSRRALLVGGAALGVAACGGPARGLDPLESIHQGLGTTPLPRPWKPLVVRGTAVEVAGHRYRFDAGPLPTSLEVNGTEFLFDAIKLDVRTQDELLVWQRARAISIDAAEVELLARGNAGDLIAQTRVIISYDGTCRIRVSLIPQGLITIDSILLDIPIVRSETTHYVHHLLGAETTLLSPQELAGVPQDQWGRRPPSRQWLVGRHYALRLGRKPQSRRHLVFGHGHRPATAGTGRPSAGATGGRRNAAPRKTHHGPT